MLSKELMESLSTWLTWSVRNGIAESDPAWRGTRLSFQLHSGAMYGDNVAILCHGVKMKILLQLCSNSYSKKPGAYLPALLDPFHIIFNTVKEWGKERGLPKQITTFKYRTQAKPDA